MRNVYKFLAGGVAALLCAGGLRAEEVPTPPAGWAAALPGWTYRFPADHLVHPDYKTEWWYFTGNLRDDRGREYGYELTFFRQGTIPPARLASLSADGAGRSRFVQGDFKFAHFAVTDVAGKKFHFTQRMTRGAFGEAGFGTVANEPLAYLEDWHLDPQPDGSWRISARANAPTLMTIELELRPEKEPVVHGAEGVSQKAAGLGNASHYYSFTRLATTGTLALGEGARVVNVRGASWFDHEWASNQLAADQVGWDWFCYQFEDRTELMLYAMRRRDGTVDPVSAGTFVAADGQTTHLDRGDFRLDATRTWTSKLTQATYPLAWRVSIPRLALEFTAEPALDDQELVLPPISYWEGATRVRGQREGKPITGSGYMELTGYAGALKGLQKPGAAEENLRLPPR